jgi:sulfur carrier protein
MRIKLNNQVKIFTEPITVQQLMDITVSQQSGVAIAVNSVVIQKTSWQNHLLKEEDDVLIIKATQGG